MIGILIVHSIVFVTIQCFISEIRTKNNEEERPESEVRIYKDKMISAYHLKKINSDLNENYKKNKVYTSWTKKERTFSKPKKKILKPLQKLSIVYFKNNVNSHKTNEFGVHI